MLAECSIRVTVLLEYLDLALDTRSWVSIHNSLAFAQILPYYCKEFLDRFSAHYSEQLRYNWVEFLFTN